MNKVIKLLVSIFLVLMICGFSYNTIDSPFSIENLYDYQRKYESTEIKACALGHTKSYMDYRATTDPTSAQYWFIRNEMEVDPVTGFLLDKDNFIGAALGSFYGTIGDRYYFTLDNGVVLPIVKVEEKADRDTDATGCYHTIDSSVIEFVVDHIAANEFFGYYGNGLVLQGNYANYPAFDGNIVKVEKVLDELKTDYVTYIDEPLLIPSKNIFEYASGY